MQKHKFKDGRCEVLISDEVVFTIVEIKQNSLSLISDEQAVNFSEAPVQINEGAEYEYEITDGFELKVSPKLARKSKLNGSTGILITGNQVGTLLIDYGPIGSTEIIGTLPFEVRSTKADYRTDYRLMLSEITDYCTELIMQAGSSVSQIFRLDPMTRASTLYQQFAFIRSLIDNPDTLNAIARIITAPVTKWKEDFEHKDISRLKRLNSKQLRAVTTSTANQSSKILSTVKRESVDCSENRFIKYALRAFADTCLRIYTNLPENSRERNEALRVGETISGFLSNSFFTDIENINSIPFNSQILQKKAGYREIFRAWLMLDVAGRLSWEGGEDVYNAGKRDVATLYEYWLFFKLLEAVQDVFKLQSPHIEDLIEPTKDGLGLKLKQGKHLVIAGTAFLPTRKLNIEFNYNKVFNSESEYPNSGSWSMILRPDYTLSIWPVGISREQSERDELITHLHFDSKYRLDTSPISDLSKIDIDEEKNGNSSYKIDDLRKMHTYRDAIRRTAGAYVLYPGSKTKNLKGFHEILPGLGAFAISPSNSETGLTDLKLFLRQVVDLIINRVSHKEKISFHTYDTYRSNEGVVLNFSLPELYNSLRPGLASNTMVLIGYYKNIEHLEWIQEKKLYNTRLTSENVALDLVPALTGSKYLLLYNDQEMITNKLYRIISQGPKVVSKQHLSETGYPTPPSKEFYLLFEIEQNVESELANLYWNVNNLLNSSKVLGLPFAVSLTELVKTSVPDK